MNLGVCYYPEHWPESQWQEDAEKMVEQGISVVRMGEFAWSRFEPEEGRYQWQWMRRALDIMAKHGLKVVLGTPTATPPRWLLTKYPEILAVDAEGRPRKFGSRRHYCFSSPVYQECSNQIVTKMVKEFGQHPAVIAWQTDNEYGCHFTIRSYSSSARIAFQGWCRRRYSDIGALNKAWGNVFWSMEYSDFSEIDLPNLTVTEANPSHVLDFYRFSSDQACSFNKSQVDIIRSHSPSREVLHNFMGYFTSFDHYKMGKDLDIATWDSYPLGFLVQFEKDQELRKRYFRTGHPDDSAFHHDLYRGVGHGRLWIMEQQPGPVNWADYNAVPLPGMVRLWTLEGFAHDAELVSYFRWRQAPFAQEQFHAALNLPDGTPSDTSGEVSELKADIEVLKNYDLAPRPCQVALLFDYESEWALSIARQGKNYDPMEWVKTIYRSLRELGLDVDIVSKEHDLSSYGLLTIPHLASCSEHFLKKLQSFKGQALIGPRTGSKTESLCIPDQLPPGLIQSLIPIRVTKVETMPQENHIPLRIGDITSSIENWREWVQSDLAPIYSADDGVGVFFRHKNVSYLNACLGKDGVKKILNDLCQEAGIPTSRLPEGVRVRRRGELTFLFNYGPTDYSLDRDHLILGERILPPGGVAVWKTDNI